MIDVMQQWVDWVEVQREEEESEEGSGCVPVSLSFFLTVISIRIY